MTQHTPEIQAEAERLMKLARDTKEINAKGINGNWIYKNSDKTLVQKIAASLQRVSDAKDRERKAAIAKAIDRAIVCVFSQCDSDNTAQRTVTAIRALKRQPGDVT